MFMMLMGVSWYAYIVSSMSMIMSSFDRQNKAIKEKMHMVNAFIHDAKLPSEISKQVRRYYEFAFSSSKNKSLLQSSQYDADALLDELSSGLRADVLLFVERELIEKIPFFKDKIPQFVADCITMFQPAVFQEGDFIVKEGSAADEMYFLVKGRCAVYYGNKKVVSIIEGSYFGEIGCIMGGIRRAGIKATTVCELQVSLLCARAMFASCSLLCARCRSPLVHSTRIADPVRSLQALSRRNLNILLGEYPDVGEELKKIARDRIQAVQKTQTVKSKQQQVVGVRQMLEKREQRSKGEVLPEVREEDEEAGEEGGGRNPDSDSMSATPEPSSRSLSVVKREQSINALVQSQGGGNVGLLSPEVNKKKMVKQMSITSGGGSQGSGGGLLSNTFAREFLETPESNHRRLTGENPNSPNSPKMDYGMEVGDAIALMNKRMESICDDYLEHQSVKK